ncbi:hypothetical protein [Streptomyces ziwulingensis]|uniref:ABC transporter domain-containing protein n=1 Tax=Streptomyces ziwulingensis TaxID=1045501 RepID=A0ABP9C4W4_9ACTN
MALLGRVRRIASLARRLVAASRHWTTHTSNPGCTEATSRKRRTAVIAVQTSRILLNGLVTGVNTTYKTGLYLGDWATFLTDAERRTRPPAAPVPVPADPSVIRATNVTFRYPGSELPALHNVSVTIRRGEVLAIVGANGSGDPPSPSSTPPRRAP